MYEPIYVIGFPKSGNTWLTRLLADALQARVSLHPMGGSLEPASEINERLALAPDTMLTIAKVHFLPAMFIEEIDADPKRIVYIYRDFRDVVVSAFFYFNTHNEADVRIANFFSVLARGPRSVLSYYRSRKKLAGYVEDLCRGDLKWFKEFASTWSQHITAWRDVLTQGSDIRFILVTYEQLLQDTASTLSKIIQEFGLTEVSAAQLETAIERQSLPALRKHFQELPNDAEIPHGKELNLKLLRKGISGDWKNFLSPSMAQIIHKYHGDLLLKLGYESDPYWYEQTKWRRNSAEAPDQRFE
jgi:hypothetical protein